MEYSIKEITDYFKGRFLTDPALIRQRLFQIKAFVFDWDGVFNGGQKDEHGSSPYNEVDAMGTNLLRFNHYLRTGKPPVTAVITGEKNKAALALARREHFQAIYCGMRYKGDALKHLCEAHGILEEEVCFVFDDVLDFSIASVAGLRMMVSRDCNPLLLQFARARGMADYLTAADGAHYAIREVAELLTGLSGQYEETITERMHFTERYQQYLKVRNEPEVQLFLNKDNVITPQDSL